MDQQLSRPAAAHDPSLVLPHKRANLERADIRQSRPRHASGATQLPSTRSSCLAAARQSNAVDSVFSILQIASRETAGVSIVSR